VSKSNIAKILGLSLATNWFGYMVIAGAVFSSGLVHAAGLETQQRCAARGWRAVAAAECGLSGRVPVLKRREWSFAGWKSTCRHCAWPSCNCCWGPELVVDGGGDFHPAAEQTGLSAGAWRAVDQRHRRGHHPIPAGLGVLEAVFVALLQHEVSRGSLVAGLLAYRAIYFLCRC
jgi:uncharacterized membrane protein YbhN (UPF0104 family)